MNAASAKRIINFRPLFFAAVGLILGIVAYVELREALEIVAYSRVSPITLALILVAVLTMVIVIATVYRRVALITIAAAMLVGMARAAIAMPRPIATGWHTVAGIIYDYSADETTTRITLTNISVDGANINYNAYISIPANNATQIMIGDRVIANAWGGAPARSYGVFDRWLMQLSREILLDVKADEVTILSHNNAPIRELIHSSRESIGAAITDILGDNAPIMSGFIIGDKSDIDDESYSVFTATGTAHILALSGFHVGVLSGCLLALLPKYKPWLRFVIVAAFLALYCALTAFSPSLVRASVMCLCVLLADAVARRRDSLSSISFAAIILLMVNPFKLWSISFLLSFTAVLGIVLTGAGGYRTSSRALSYTLNGLSVSFGASAATALVSARFFGVFSTYSLLANAISIPIYTLSIIIGVALIPLYYVFPGMAQLFSALPNALNGVAMYILEGVSRLPFAVIRVSPPSILSCTLFVLMMFILSKYVLRPLWRRIMLAGCVMILFTASLLADIMST